MSLREQFSVFVIPYWASSRVLQAFPNEKCSPVGHLQSNPIHTLAGY